MKNITWLGFCCLYEWDPFRMSFGIDSLATMTLHHKSLKAEF